MEEMVFRGITLSPAQAAGHHKLFTSYFAAMRAWCVAFTPGLSDEAEAARTATRQALTTQYQKDYRAILTPAQRVLFDQNITDIKKFDLSR